MKALRLSMRDYAKRLRNGWSYIWKRKQISKRLVIFFVGQAPQDIRKKWQKVDGIGRISISQLIESIYKIYNNREGKKEKKKQAKMKLQASLLAVTIMDRRALGVRGRGEEDMEEGAKGVLEQDWYARALLWARISVLFVGRRDTGKISITARKRKNNSAEKH